LLEESLKKVDTSETLAVRRIIDQFAEQPSLKENSSLNRLEIINKCFSKRTVEEIISALEQRASNLADEWVAATIQSLKKASPTSLKIALRSVSLRNNLISTSIPPQLCPSYQNIVVSFFLFLTLVSDKRRENTNYWGVFASGI
jgi:hypothetical protein